MTGRSIRTRKMQMTTEGVIIEKVVIDELTKLYVDRNIHANSVVNDKRTVSLQT